MPELKRIPKVYVGDPYWSVDCEICGHIFDAHSEASAEKEAELHKKEHEEQDDE